MTKAEEKALRDRARDRMEDYLQSRGINIKKAFRCLNPDHEDRHPSMAFDPRRQRVHCFACGVDWDIFTLVGMEYGIDHFGEQVQKACSLLGLKTDAKALSAASLPPSRTARRRTAPAPASSEGGTPSGHLTPPSDDAATVAYLSACRARLGDTDYPARRGLSAETATRFGLGYDPAFAQGTGPIPWRALIIPTGPDSYTARNTDPDADKRSRVRKHGASPICFAKALWEPGPPLFVVEGEIDALSVYEAGGVAVALGSTANAQRFLRMVAEKPPARTLLIAMDEDDEGRRCAGTLLEGLSAAGIAHHRVSFGPEGKDANDALLADPAGFAALVGALSAVDAEAEALAREEYASTCLHADYQAFLDGLAGSVDTPFVPTGFPCLDRHLDGGLYEGLYVVGAISSLGKTSLVLQIADQIAASGQDVLLISLEMARRELLAKSLSRMTLQETLRQQADAGFAKTVRDITVASRWAGYSFIDRQLFADAAEAYRPATRHLYVHEGVGDIGAQEIAELVQRHIRYTGKRPVVVIDYLQILAPYSERATDKQNTDKAVLELKRLSRDHGLPRVCISSFNRASYREAVTMEAFKESGAIEYSSDVLIGLQLRGAGLQGFDPTAEKEKDPRQVELVVLKNRNGPAGRRVAFDYYARYNFFRERG